MAYDTFTLTGTYLLPSGTPHSGVVEIIPSETVIKDTTGNVILTGRAKITLEEDGSFDVVLPDPRDTTLNPAGFGYTVAAKLRSSHPPAVSFGGDQIAAAIVGGVVNIEDVTSVDPSTFAPEATYAESSTVTALDARVTTLEERPAGGTADSTTFTPAGSLTATDVQGALVELDAEVAVKVDEADLDTQTAVLIDEAGSEVSARLNAAYVRHAGNGSSDDTARLNALLSSGGYVKGSPGETYTISATLVIGSDTTLDMTGCTIQWKAGVQGNNLLRSASATPQRTVTDAAITAGATTLTSASAAFTAADVGRVVNITGAGGATGRPTVLTAVVSSVTNATTAELDTPARLTVTGARARFHDRASNIRVIGGKWDRGAAVGVTDADGYDNGLHGLLFHHVTDLVVSIEGYYSTQLGAKYAVYLADAHRFTASVEHFDTISDGVHITGPASNGRIPHLSGFTWDDMVSLTGADYPAYSPTTGNITDVHVGSIYPDGCRGIFKIVPGAGNRIDRFKADFAAGSGDASGAFIGEDANYPDTMGGTCGLIDMGVLNYTVQSSVLKIVNANVEKVIAQVGGRSLEDLPVKVLHASTASAFTVGELILDDCRASSGQFVSMDATSGTVERLTLNRAITDGGAVVVLAVNGTLQEVLVNQSDITYTGAGTAPFFCNGGTIGHLRLTDTLVNVAGSTNVAKPVVLRSTGAVNAVTVTRGKITGGGTVGVVAYDPTASLFTLTLDGCELASLKRVCDGIGGGLTAILRYPVVNCSLEMFHVGAGGATIVGAVASITGTGSRILTATSAGTRRINGANLPNDVTGLTPQAGDMVRNTNASHAAGAGVLISNGTGWSNLYTGVTA